MALDITSADIAEIKNRIKVSDVVGKKWQLRKQGSEFVVADNPSFTVSDSKKLWKDFGNGGAEKAGDIFDFLEQHEGYTKVGAIEALAAQAGIQLKTRPGRSPATANGDGRPEAPPPERDDRGPPAKAEGKLETVATWDIFGPENDLLYQVVRRQRRMPDGSWDTNREGKVWKTIAQRRPSPEGDGTWLWGLDVIDRKSNVPLEFLRWRSDGDWVRSTPERKKVGNPEVRSFPDARNVDHWLYNANDVIDELAEPAEDQRPIFFPEGEKKVDVLKEWGLLALCNTGGAGNFTAECAEFFRGAGHVVFLQDNDRAGAERIAKAAPMLKAVGVQLISALNFRDIWPACPIKGDVVDWRDAGGGTKAQLLEAVDSLKPWAPEPYKSRFGAKTAADLSAPAKPYPWRIKGLVPLNDDMLIMGPSRSGKSFEALDMTMAVHFDTTFAGRKIIPGGCIYLTYEGATGFENRLRAYMIHRNLSIDDLHSFAWLTRPPGIYASEDNVGALAEEIAHLAATFRLPLSHVVIDTHNAATRGSSEIKSEDIDKIVTRYSMIRERVGAPLWIIGHTNADGKHRGNEQFFNGIETALLIRRLTENGKPDGKERRDEEGRVIRRAEVNKQRDGADTIHWDFVLKRIEIGTDEDGDKIPSMVSAEPARQPTHEAEQVDRRNKADGFQLTQNHSAVFRALLKTLDEHGEPPPAALQLPKSVARVVRWVHLGVEVKDSDPQEHDEPNNKYRDRIKARLRRFREDLLPYNVIAIASAFDAEAPAPAVGEKPKMVSYVWPTGKRVVGKGLQWPPVARKKPESKPLLAPGETEADLRDDRSDDAPPKTVF